MKKKVSQVIFPLLFIVCIASGFEASLFAFSKEHKSFVMIFFHQNHGAFPHNHVEEPEISHEFFFRHNDLSEHSGITVHFEKIKLNIFCAQMKFTPTHWHPPRLI